MPGFMQSIKSHLPQSPFSPNKKGAAPATPTEVAAPTVEGAVAEEQPTPEVLPGEALVQHNSSTVALTLTPANGESSQQLIADDTEVTPSAAPITESESPAEPSVVAEATPVEATEVQTETVEAEAPQPIAEEATPAATIEAPAAACETAVVEPTTEVEADVAAAPESTTVEAVEPQAEDGEAKPEAQVVEETAAPAEEPTVATTDVPSTPTEAETPKGKAGKEFSTHVKRSKSKKCKSDAPESSDVGESAPCKPRKSHPLAGKFRSVIEQVRSKVKKDKDALVAKEGLITPPAVAVIDPTPVSEETVAAA